MIGLGLEPFAQGGLDEAFGFVVRARAIGLGGEVLGIDLNEGGLEVTAVGVGVVGHDPFDGDAGRGEPLHGAAGGKRRRFVRARPARGLGVGKPGGVVDGDVQEYSQPLGRLRSLRSPVMRRPASGDSAELFDVDLGGSFAGPGALVADHRGRGIERCQASESRDAAMSGRRSRVGTPRARGIRGPAGRERLRAFRSRRPGVAPDDGASGATPGLRSASAGGSPLR